MQRFQNPYPGGGNGRSAGDWPAEISGGMTETSTRDTVSDATWQTSADTGLVFTPTGQAFPAGNMPGMRTELPNEVVQSPVSGEEAYQGSLKAMLARNEGNYVVATFLVGTQGTVSWEGILHDVGNDFLTIYQPGRERYIVIDIYSLKYIEFYDTSRRRQCEAMMNQNGWQEHY